MAHFVFLEFLDPIVEGTLRELRQALQPWKKTLSPIHVTVRGPYRSEPNVETLRELAQGIRGQGIRIIGAGFFSHGLDFSVFLRAESAVFRNLWWKPDFPSGRTEIQPHLTMFESTDRASAMMTFNFLKASRISILTHSVQLSIYSSGQSDLFGTRPVHEMLPTASSQRDVVAIDPEVLPAARDLGQRLASHRNGLKQGSTSDA